MSATQSVEPSPSLPPPAKAPNGKTRASAPRVYRSHRKAAAAAAAPATTAVAAAKTAPTVVKRIQAPSTSERIAAAAPVPAVLALCEELPATSKPWNMDEAVAWLQAIAATVRFTYKIPGALTVAGTPATA